MDSIYSRVEALCKKHGTRDPFALCDALGVIVLICDLPRPIRGFYHYMKRNRFIYLNALLTERMLRIVCAHELGHAVLHRNAGDTFVEGEGRGVHARLEREADIFCISLLKGESLTDCELHGTPLEHVAAASNLQKSSAPMEFRSPVARYRCGGG